MESGSTEQTTQQPVRRSANRPGMVPLSEFGKPAPPPPRTPTNWRGLIITIGVIVLIVALSGWAIASESGPARAIWGHTQCLDARKGC